MQTNKQTNKQKQHYMKEDDRGCGCKKQAFFSQLQKLRLKYKCDDLLSHNSSLPSSHIWFSYIHNFSNIWVTLFRSMRRVCVYHGPKTVFNDFRTSKLVNVVRNRKKKTHLFHAKTILSFERKCWAFSLRRFGDWMSAYVYSLQFSSVRM